MKKVKIMLMSAVVLAAVGGALAFKSKAAPGLFCTDTLGQACTVPMILQFDGANAENSISYCTITQGNTDCTWAKEED